MNIAGMRIFKTCLTVFLAALVAQSINPENQFVILYTSLIAMETTLSSSVEIGVKRVVGTAVGALVANALIYSAMPFPLALPIAVLVLIVVSNRLNLQGSVGISGSVMILILLAGYAGDDPWLYAFDRLRDTIIAITLSVIVNLLIFRPKVTHQVELQEDRLYDETLTMVEQVYLYRVADNLEAYRKEVQKLSESIHRAATEVRRAENRDRLDTYRRLVKVYQAIYIYSENLSLMGQDMRVTDANQKALTDMFGHEEVLENEWDESKMTPKEVIYNYTLERLIESLQKLKGHAAERSGEP